MIPLICKYNTQTYYNIRNHFGINCVLGDKHYVLAIITPIFQILEKVKDLPRVPQLISDKAGT